MLCRVPSICRVHPFIPMYQAYFLLILTQNLCVKAHRCTRHTLPGSPNNELYLSASHLAASGRPFDFMQSSEQEAEGTVVWLGFQEELKVGRALSYRPVSTFDSARRRRALLLAGKRVTY